MHTQHNSFGKYHDHGYRILLAAHQVFNVTSGPGVFARNLIARLLQDGHSITVITQAGETEDIPEGVKVFKIPRQPINIGQARWFFLSISIGKAMKEMAVSGEYFDLVHYVDARECCFCPTIWPSVGNVNDTYSLEVDPLGYYLARYIDGFPRWIYYRINRIFERRAYRKLDKVLANSHYTERMLLNSFPELQGKTTTVYKSINATNYPSHQRSEPSKTILLLVGSNLQRKGINPLLEAAALLRPKFQDLEIHLVGSDPLARRYRKKAQALGIGDACHFFGQVNQAHIQDFYRKATIYCLPSLKEALGISILEAMAVGIPVVASRTGGIPEIIQDGINGLLCEPGDPESLARCISRMLSEPSLVEKCVQAGFVTVQNFSVEKMYAGVLAEYSRLAPTSAG